MATTTSTILGLTIPTPGTAEPYSRTVENANLAKIENAIGAKAVKFTTTTISNSTTETQLHGGTIPLNSGQAAAYRLVCWGTYDNSAVATNFNVRAKIGGVQVTLGSIVTPASLQTNSSWNFESEIVLLTTGVTGTWSGKLLLNTNSSAGGPFNAVLVPGATTRDTTVNNTFEITAQWTAASASNIVRCFAGYFERISNS